MSKVSAKRANDVDRPNAHTVTTTDPLGKVTTVTAHTNERGKGLWVDGQQVMGTGEFNIRRHNICAYFHNRFR